MKEWTGLVMDCSEAQACVILKQQGLCRCTQRGGSVWADTAELSLLIIVSCIKESEDLDKSTGRGTVWETAHSLRAAHWCIVGCRVWLRSQWVVMTDKIQTIIWFDIREHFTEPFYTPKAFCDDILVTGLLIMQSSIFIVFMSSADNKCLIVSCLSYNNFDSNKNLISIHLVSSYKCAG